MATRGHATHKRIVKLAFACGFDTFVAPEERTLGLCQMLDDVPDKDLREFEAVLKDLRGLQEAIRGPN